MRIVVFMLFVTLIGFGYILSDNGHLQANLRKSEQQTTSIVTERDTLQFQLENARSELALLAAQNDELERQILLLSSQNEQTQNEKQLLESQNVQLQDQIHKMHRLNTLTEKILDLSPVELLLAIFVPILPISLGSGFLAYRYGKIQRNSYQNTSRAHRTFSMLVTKEEMRKIRQIRRN